MSTLICKLSSPFVADLNLRPCWLKIECVDLIENPHQMWHHFTNKIDENSWTVIESISHFPPGSTFPSPPISTPFHTSDLGGKSPPDREATKATGRLGAGVQGLVGNSETHRWHMMTWPTQGYLKHVKTQMASEQQDSRLLQQRKEWFKKQEVGVLTDQNAQRLSKIGKIQQKWKCTWPKKMRGTTGGYGPHRDTESRVDSLLWLGRAWRNGAVNSYFSYGKS